MNLSCLTTTGAQGGSIEARNRTSMVQNRRWLGMSCWWCGFSRSFGGPRVSQDNQSNKESRIHTSPESNTSEDPCLLDLLLCIPLCGIGGRTKARLDSVSIFSDWLHDLQPDVWFRCSKLKAGNARGKEQRRASHNPGYCAQQVAQKRRPM